MERAQSYLVVDDDADVLKAAATALMRPGVHVEAVASPEGLAAKAQGAAAVLLDMNFAAGARSGAEGFDALAALQDADPSLSVVLMTTYGGVALAVEALKRGAVDFVLKPWRNEALADAMAAAARLTAERRAGAPLNLDDLERRAIERALAIHEGNVSRAALALGLTRPALYRRMARHGL
ncbi:response regulator [Phenylobacterium sp.]|uniref:response regulator n=1 Tax=Phenylobacterium sp. TaxID=1871053 RepID=UPI002DF17E0A|nr:response regulator [Phenylobacterium sp.]